MGTSGSFGGSRTASWQKVADNIAGLDSETSAGASGDLVGEGDDDSAGGEQVPSSPGATALAALIAQALQNDDPAIKPSRAPRRVQGDSGISYGQLVGKPRWTGTSKPAPTSGRRQIAAGAGRAGRAVGAGYALASGNGAALSEYGLDLAMLQGLDRYGQIFAILDAVDVQGPGPDDIALRSTIVQALDRVIDPDTDNPPPEETLRELVGTYTIHLLSIELDALIQRGEIPAETINAHRVELADYVRIRAERLIVDEIVLTTPQHFEHAARELLRATLGLIAAGEGP